MLRFFAAVLSVIILLFAASGYAAVHMFGFDIFTNNGMYNDDPGANFYFLLSDDGGLPKFEFHNESTFASVITRVYFDGDVLSGIAGIDQSAGVLFSIDGAPSNLPAGNELMPPFVADFSVSANPPPSFNGINNSLTEWLAVTMNLASGKTFNDVYEALLNAELRVGIHIQAFPDGSSESAYNPPEEIIPEPSIMSLLGLAGLGLIWKKRKK